MDDSTVFVVLALVFHSVLLFFDIVFKSCSHYPYLHFLKQTGLEVNPFRIRWFTTAFNRQIQKWGTKRPKLLTAWFTAGAWVTVAIMPLAVMLVLHTTFTALKASVHDIRNNVLVEPLVPGWNLPSSDIGYYLVSHIVSTIIHELGHALAAVREDVHLIGFDFSIFFIIPVAATHLNQLDTLPVFKQLRVQCAGVWHNIFLSLLAAIVATALPWLLFPFFDFGTGVQVEFIKQGSPFSVEGGLILGDKIVELNQCQIRGITSWQDCIVQINQEPNAGFCIPDSFIKDQDESVPAKHVSESLVECCDSNSPRHLCFEYVGTDDEPLPLPQHSCLLARSVVDMKPQHCSAPPDCPSSLHCFRPSLENSTKLVQIHRSRGPTVLFLGNPVEIYHSVTVTDFISIYKFFPSTIPDALTKLCQFITIFSSGLAILNVIPCFYFDGQLILRTLNEIFLSKRIPLVSARNAVSLCITMFCTLMLTLYILVYIFSVMFGSI